VVPMLKTNHIHCGDHIELMKQIDGGVIDLTITSPPYDNLREYNGYTFDYKKCLEELFRITTPGGIVVWVVGDATVEGSETGTSFKQALYSKQIGFNLHDTMIYRKGFYLPLNHNRCEQEFEYIFVLSKGKPKTFNAIKVKTKHPGKPSTITHRKDGVAITKGTGYGKERKMYRISGNIFKYNPKRWSKHPAPFPDDLAKDNILMWSNKGDIVFDPMVGSGTVPIMAKQLQRNYLGIDISEEYCKITKQQLSQSTLEVEQ